MRVDVSQFKQLKLSDYIQKKYLKEVTSFEYMERQWLGQIIGFTQFLQLEKDPGITKAVLLDFQDLDQKHIGELVLRRIGIPLKSGMRLNEVNSVLEQEPVRTSSFVNDRVEHEYLDSTNDSLYLSCVINKNLGLVFVSIIIDEEIIANIRGDLY